MQYASIPGTAVPASRIVLGAAWFGTSIPEDQAFAILDAFLQAGGTFIDTAHMYAGWVPGGAGKSESTLGKWLKRARPANPAVRVATKGADQGMTDQGIRKQLAESLDRLGLDRLDFYWLHSDDTRVPVGEILEWLNELVRQGRFPAFGCSNWSVERIAQAQLYAAEKRIRPFAASQIGFSLGRVKPELIARGPQVFMDDPTLAYHRATGLPIVAYSSQAGGFFAGNYDPKGPPPGVTPNANIVRYYGSDDNYARLRLVNQLAQRYHATPNQVALAFLLQQDFPCFPIVGANSPDRVLDSCRAADLTLTPAELQQLERPSR